LRFDGEFLYDYKLKGKYYVNDHFSIWRWIFM